MEVKSIFDLSLEDFSKNTIWVDYECAERFCKDFSYDTKYNEDHVVKITSDEYHQIRLHDLQDIGSFYIGCEIVFSNEEEHQGIAYIRANDLCPYHAVVFFRDATDQIQQLQLPLEEDSEFIEGDKEIIQESLKINRDKIYPVRIGYKLEFISIEEDIEFQM